MKRKLLSLLLALTFVVSIPLSVNANSEIKIKLKGNYIKTDVNPIVENQRTLVPIRVISENLGYEVHWDSSNKTIGIFSYSADKTAVTKALMLVLNEPVLVDLNANYLTEQAHKMHLGVFDENESAKLLLENAKYTPLDVAPKAYNNRTLVPLRAISESFGLKVEWDSKTNTIVIY